MSGQDLINAAEKGNVDELTRLLESGVDVNYRNWSWVSISTTKEQIQMTNIMFQNNWTALHYAADRGYYHCTKILLSHPNVDINAKDQVSGSDIPMNFFFGFFGTL